MSNVTSSALSNSTTDEMVRPRELMAFAQPPVIQVRGRYWKEFEGSPGYPKLTLTLAERPPGWGRRPQGRWICPHDCGHELEHFTDWPYGETRWEGACPLCKHALAYLPSPGVVRCTRTFSWAQLPAWRCPNCEVWWRRESVLDPPSHRAVVDGRGQSRTAA